MLKRIVLPGHGKDIPILIAVIANVFCVVVAFPTNYNPFRQSFFTQIVGRDEFSQKENYIFTAVILLVTMVIAIVFPNIK